MGIEKKQNEKNSNNINKEHKGITSLKKDTPKDEIEKLTKQKIEKSIRHRAYEYSKLVRAGKFKDENENLGKNDNLGVIPENDDDLYLIFLKFFWIKINFYIFYKN